MGEKEQGGMLRTIVVIGLISMMAVIIISLVVGLTRTVSKQSDAGVDVISKAVNVDTNSKTTNVNAGDQDDYETSKFKYASFDNKNHTVTIMGYKIRNNQESSLVIPSTVMKDGVVYKITKIGDHAFADNELTSIVIPDGVTEIGMAAFQGNNLTSIIIPDSVVSVRKQAFCLNHLTSITFSKSMSVVEFASFSDNNLETVTIPANIQIINQDAFKDNYNLKQVVIENHDVSINQDAFMDDGNVKIIHK